MLHWKFGPHKNVLMLLLLHLRRCVEFLLRNMFYCNIDIVFFGNVQTQLWPAIEALSTNGAKELPLLSALEASVVCQRSGMSIAAATLTREQSVSVFLVGAATSLGMHLSNWPTHRVLKSKLLIVLFNPKYITIKWCLCVT